MFEYKGQKFLTDNDLEVNILGRSPEIRIQNKELRKIFKEKYGRDFLGGDEIISYRQALVAKGMQFDKLEEEILKDIKDSEKLDIKEIVFAKTATGIGRGHSMGGLSGITFGLHGTKMIDSGLTGLVASRSLTTSGRRREIAEEDIVIPESITKRKDLLNEYLEISRAAFKESKDFKTKFGRLSGIEAFNKALSYNNPADLFIFLPLDTMATLAFEVKQDKLNSNGPFVPREIYTLVEKFPEIAEENGLGTMYKQRIQVPRDTYFHYTVFKDPDSPNHTLDLAEKLGMPKKPQIIDSHIDLTKDFKKGLNNLKEIFEQTRKITDPEELSEAANECMLATRSFTEEYNEAVKITILDNLSFRVWSEQKRHATLRQNVESIYSAVKRASEKMKKIWSGIKGVYNKDGYFEISKLEEIMVIDEKLKKNQELLIPYAYHTGKQLMFFDKLVKEGIPLRDAAYVIPRNIKTTNLESYDLKNLIDLELPLRLCTACEPERYATSWEKRDLIAKTIPELEYFLQPKCNVGFCTEANYCKHITNLREYDKDLHNQTKQAMLNKAK